MSQHRHKIYGGPGCGKTTRALALLDEELRRGVPLDRIAFLTFTRNARREAQARMRATVATDGAPIPYVKTIHALCFQELHTSSDRMLGREALQEFAKHAGLEFSQSDGFDEDLGLYVGSRVTEADRLLTFDHLRRTRQQTVDEALKAYPGSAPPRLAHWFTAAYRSWKQGSGYVDFTDLLEAYLAHGRPLPVTALFVDEAQDLSRLQWAVVEKMAARAERVYAIGDDDQAIYQWAGADADGFLTWHADADEVLPVSWRLPAAVHAFALKTINRVRQRKLKIFRPTDRTGSVRHVNTPVPELPATGSVQILYRNHYLGARIHAELQEQGIPYHGAKSAFDHPEALGAILAWESWRGGSSITVAQLRNIFEWVPTATGAVKRGAKSALTHAPGEQTIPTTDATARGVLRWGPWDAVLTRIPGVEQLQRAVDHGGLDALRQPPRVTVSTIHRMKGSEADHVVVLADLGSATYQEYARAPDAEHKVFYVAATRARETLTLVDPQSSYYYRWS